MKKKLITILISLLFAGFSFADTYTIKVTGTATKKTVEGEYVELTGECYIDDEDTLMLEEGSMVEFSIGKTPYKIKGPKSPIKFGELLKKIGVK